MTIAGDREIPYPRPHLSQLCDIGVSGTHLLTMNENISATAERAGDVFARAFEMRF